LVSTVDDWDYGVTHVVRGADLLPASGLHRELAGRLGAPQVKFAHHPLLTGADGGKLSKSQGTAQLDLSSDLRRFVTATAARLLPDVLAELTQG
jgi:glutamyl-Q tRNA(Asp) synthetase